MKRKLAVFSGALISVSVLACAAQQPKKTVITPKVSFKSTTEVVNGQPDCAPFIMEALSDVSRGPMVEAFGCYDRTIQHWQDEYEVLESQMNILTGEEGMRNGH